MPNRRGVSLVELLMVFAIISILMGLSIPAVLKARERARDKVCENNLYQMSLALQQYHELFKQLPLEPPRGKVGGWSMAILPFLEQRRMFAATPFWQDPSAVTPELYRPPAIMLCPSRNRFEQTTPDSIAFTQYLADLDYRKESWNIFDAPLEARIEWVISPTMSASTMSLRTGPHNRGYYQHGSFGAQFVPGK